MSNMVNLAKKNNIMDKQKYEQLKNKIIEAVPEILEREILYRYNKVWDAWNINTMTREDFEEVDLSEDITLEDVFVVINEKEHLISNTIPTCDFGWKMGEPLHNQSDETKEFLYNILIEK